MCLVGDIVAGFSVSECVERKKQMPELVLGVAGRDCIKNESLLVCMGADVWLSGRGECRDCL